MKAWLWTKTHQIITKLPLQSSTKAPKITPNTATPHLVSAPISAAPLPPGSYKCAHALSLALAAAASRALVTVAKPLVDSAANVTPFEPEDVGFAAIHPGKSAEAVVCGALTTSAAPPAEV